MVFANPGRMFPPLMKPDSTEVAISPRPTTRISPKLRRYDQGNPGRSAFGTSQTELSAFCMALATPRAPKKVSRIPMTSAGPVSWNEPS